MTSHEIRHRLTNINKFALESIRGCGYTSDYDAALKHIIRMVCDLGDELDKQGEA